MRLRMMGRSRLAASVATIAMVAVAGCGSESNEPKEKDWDEGSQSQQQSDSDDKSKDDGKGEEKDDGGDKTVRQGDDTGRTDAGTASGAEDFIADYLDAENVAIKDGDFSKVNSMVENCDVCTASRKTIEEVYQDGGKIEGSLFTEPKIDAGRETKGTVTVTVVSTISAYKVTDSGGTVVDQEPAKEQTFQYGVSKKTGEWQIVSGEFLK